MTRETIYRMLSMTDFELELYLKEHDYDERYLKKIARMKESAVDTYDSDLYKRLSELEQFISQRMPSATSDSIFMPQRNNNHFFSDN